MTSPRSRAASLVRAAAAIVGRAVRAAEVRPRPRESLLLVLVAVTIAAGSIALAATRSALDDGSATWNVGLADAPAFIVYFGVVLAAHLLLILSGRRTDQILLPTVAMLGGISLLLMERLPQGLAGGPAGLAGTQLLWLALSLTVVAILATVVRSDAWLRLYKYTWAAGGIALLALTFVFGDEVNGQRLSLSIGPFSGQPSELLKVILVVFLAGYLAENRSLLEREATRVGPLRLPPFPYLLPMAAMWAIALLVVVIQRDLGAALLLFAIFLFLLYVATARASFVVIGVALFVGGAGLMARLFGHVQTRIDIWLDPFADASGAGYQVVQALEAFARGGLLGTGLGAGLPMVGGRLPIPAIHTDFPLAALGEELGLIGILAILGLYLVVIERGLRIAASARDDFQALLATGLSLVVGVQAFIIAAGNLKLIPLTGITLPFISFGGSSLLANGVVVGLLLALSDRAVEGRSARRPARRRVLRPLSPRPPEPSASVP